MFMKKTLFSAALALAFGLVAVQASAADGTITFNGEITDTTCTITGGGAATGTGNVTVTLPTVSTSALPAAGKTAGETSFSLVLGGGTGCTNGKTAALWVETASTLDLDASTGALKNHVVGGAANVQVQMVNPANGNPILLNINNAVTNGATVIAGSNQPAATIAGNTATLKYVGRYLATGVAGAGAVQSVMTYSMQYN